MYSPDNKEDEGYGNAAKRRCTEVSEHEESPEQKVPQVEYRQPTMGSISTDAAFSFYGAHASHFNSAVTPGAVYGNYYGNAYYAQNEVAPSTVNYA